MTPALTEQPGATAGKTAAAARPPFGAVLRGTSALAVATGLERGLTLLANLAAARLGGAGVFGAYSLALSTANSVAVYAGLGVGTTALRFSAEHPRGSAGYAALTRALLLISSLSALLASALLFAGAEPLARTVLRNPGLTDLLRGAALSSGLMVLLECGRGFLIGQQRTRALVLVSAAMGVGLLATLPLASLWGPIPMIAAQCAVVVTVLAACLLFARPLGLLPEGPAPAAQTALWPVMRQVWRFGLVQLASVVGLNAAGWWVASLVARGDATLVQVGLFAVANQLRNMAALLPGLVTQGSYALLADGQTQDGSARSVLAFCTFAASLAGLLLAGPAMIVLPWVLPLVYGPSYASGALPAALALATAVIHMGGAPAAARLTIVSLRRTGLINLVWTVLVLLVATPVVPVWGATGATGIYLLTHVVSAALVLGSLKQSGPLPAGLLPVSAVALLATLGLAALACLRAAHAAPDAALAGAMLLLLAGACAGLAALGRRHGWVPSNLREAGPALFRTRMA